jgi:hypothetical protein
VIGRSSIKEKPFTHLQFKIELYYKLLSYFEKAKLQHLRVGLRGKRVFNPDL